MSVTSYSYIFNVTIHYNNPFSVRDFIVVEITETRNGEKDVILFVNFLLRLKSIMAGNELPLHTVSVKLATHFGEFFLEKISTIKSSMSDPNPSPTASIPFQVPCDIRFSEFTSLSETKVSQLIKINSSS